MCQVVHVCRAGAWLTLTSPFLMQRLRQASASPLATPSPDASRRPGCPPTRSTYSSRPRMTRVCATSLAFDTSRVSLEAAPVANSESNGQKMRAISTSSNCRKTKREATLSSSLSIKQWPL
jgi:hypothetical protein